jgi:hypothetical protein
MMKTTREDVTENEDHGPSHITSFFDGSWQKHGQTSLSGILSATFFDRGKV